MKIADLNFYAFIEFLKILEEKFQGFFFNYDNLNPFCLEITSVPKEKTDMGEISLEIKNPLESILENDNPTQIDLPDKFITFQLCIHPSNPIDLTVKQEVFDDEGFIQILTDLIGKIAPVRRDHDSWYEKVTKWLLKEIEDSGLKKYCFKIEEAK